MYHTHPLFRHTFLVWHIANFWLIRFRTQSGISSEQYNCEDSNDVSAFTIGCIIKKVWQFLRAQLKSIPCHISKCFLALVNQSESQNWSHYTNSLLHLSPWADLNVHIMWLSLVIMHTYIHSKGCSTCGAAVRNKQSSWLCNDSFLFTTTIAEWPAVGPVPKWR